MFSLNFKPEKDLIKISMCDSMDAISHLGPGIPLFFDFAKFSIFSMIICFVIWGAYASYRNSRGGYCELMNNRPGLDPDQPSYCGSSWKTIFSGGNRNQMIEDQVENWLSLLLCLLLITYRIISFRFARKKDCDVDDQNTTPVDYTVMLTNLPKRIQPEDVIKAFEKLTLSNDLPPKVAGVNFAYYIGNWAALKAESEELLRRLRTENQKKERDLRKVKILENRLEDVREKFKGINDILEGREGIERKNQLFTGIAFVTFNLQKEAEDVLEKFEVGFLRMMASRYLNFMKNCFSGTEQLIEGRDGKDVKVIEPPEPTDVLWKNLGTPTWFVIKRRVITNALSFALLLLSFSGILGLKLLQYSYKNAQTNSNTLLVISMVIAGFIALINLVLKNAMRVIAEKEYYYTTTGFHTGVLKKMNWVSRLHRGLI